MYLDIPVFVEIVDTSDAAAVTVRVINMADVPCPVTWVTGNHALKTKEIRSLVEQKKKNNKKKYLMQHHQINLLYCVARL